MLRKAFIAHSVPVTMWLVLGSIQYLVSFVCYLFQIGCEGDEPPKLCGEARPESMAFSCSVVQIEFITDRGTNHAGFRLRYNIFYSPSTGNVHNVISMLLLSCICFTQPVTVAVLITATADSVYCIIAVVDPEAKARASGREREMGRARASENFSRSEREK